MVLPVMVTVLLLPTVFEEKVPVADVVLSVTVSPRTLPTSAAEPFTKVAVVLALYTLFEAVMPEMVSSFAVMFAVVVGWVSV